MKIVWFHKSLPEYRVKLFQEISKIADAKFYIDSVDFSQKIYGYDSNETIKTLNVLDKKLFSSRNLEAYKNCDSIIIQTPDSFHDIFMAMCQLLIGKHYNKKIALFWERWRYREKTYWKNEIKQNVHDFLVKPIVKHCDVLMASGSKTKEYYISLGVEESKIRIVGDCSTPPDVEFEDIREKYGIPKDATLFLYLGRLIELKGADVLVDAFQKMLDETGKEETYLLVAGDGPLLQKCMDLVESKWKKQILFCGYVRPETRKNYFWAADCFVIPDVWINGCVDAWGLTVNEAMNCGVPVIASDICGSAYDMINKNTGVIWKDDIEKLSGLISKFNKDKFDMSKIKQFVSNYSEQCISQNIFNSIN